MLKVNEVNFSYKNSVLEKISFQVKSLEFFGLIGPNGSGKTTLLRLLAGYLVPAQGEVLLNNKNILYFKHKERARYISVVPQYHLVNQFFTVQQLLEMARQPYHSFFKRMSRQEYRKIDELSEKMGILEFKHRLLKTLSGGELQRVLITKALVQDTPIIIMDEPTNHLDIHHQTEIMNIIKEYQRQGKTIISVFHDLNFAAKYCDNVLVLDKTVKAIGKPHEVINKEILKDVFHTEDYEVSKDFRVVLK